MSKRGDIHVVPHNNGWATKKEGAQRVGAKTDTQKQAIELARNQAKREKTEVVIHGRDNKIRDSDSYGRDSSPPRDKKH